MTWPSPHPLPLTGSICQGCAAQLVLDDECPSAEHCTELKRHLTVELLESLGVLRQSIEHDPASNVSDRTRFDA